MACGAAPAERHPGCGALLPDDVIDQAVHAVARDFGAASMLEATPSSAATSAAWSMFGPCWRT